MKNLLLAALVITNTAFAQHTAPPSEILGEWRGQSVCTNLTLAPACKDETIRYVFTAAKDSPNRFHLVAEKLVDGKFEPMGEFDLDYSTTAYAWQYDFETRDRMKLRWEYKIEDSTLSGAVLVRDSGERLRRVTASRVKAR
jgi:hypothetical protein